MCGWLAAILGLAALAGCSDDAADAESGSDASTAGRVQDDDGSAGASAGAGRGNAGAGAGAGASAGANGAAGRGGGGSGGPVDNRCASDGDCVLCTLPLSTELPCCDGCPSVMSSAQCDAERAAAAGECKPGMLPICPAISCVAPGSPKCEGGMCISVDGFEL